MQIISVLLDKILPKEELELLLGIRFVKSAEKSMYARLDDGYVFWTKFGVLTFYGFYAEQVSEFLRRLKVNNFEYFQKSMIFQDYLLRIDSSIDKPFVITNDEIVLKEFSINLLSVAALVVAQSVALEKYELLLDKELPKSRRLLSDFKNLSIGRRTKLVSFASSLALLRQEIVVDLHLLDKPNILWDDEVAENAYSTLSAALELTDRFRIVEYKLSLLKDDILFVMDIINHKHSEFLEWIIIFLIAFEIVMGLAKMIV